MTDWTARAREIAASYPWPTKDGVLEKAIAALAAEACQAGQQQRIEELDLVKDGVCLVCGVDPVDTHNAGHAAGVAEERARIIAGMEQLATELREQIPDFGTCVDEEWTKGKFVEHSATTIDAMLAALRAGRGSSG